MLDKIKQAFVRMTRCGIYARYDFPGNAASATPAVMGKAIRLVRQGQPYHGIAVFTEDDRRAFENGSPLRVSFAPVIPPDPDRVVRQDEVARLGREVGIGVMNCLQAEGLAAEWVGNPSEAIVVTGVAAAV